jgi:AraC-like DNA-binding protein
LESLSYEELLTEFNEYNGDPINLEMIARTYLNRARKEKDTIKMARGYDRLARIFDSEKNIQFADSIIELTDHIRHKTYPALAYMIRGYEYDALNDVIRSTDNYIKAFQISSETENMPQQVFLMHLLIFNKAIWGNKIDALKMQKERHALINKPNYINFVMESTRESANIDINQLIINEKILSYQSYVHCYKQLNKIDSATIFLDKGITELDKYNWVGKDSHRAFFDEAKIELEFTNGNFELTISLAAEYLNKYGNNLTLDETFNILYLNGMSNLRNGDSKKAIQDFKKADSIFNVGNIIVRPHYRGIFEELRRYYKYNSNLHEEIRTLDKLIQIDSISKQYYQYFEPNMIRNFETPKLLHEKEILISSLEYRNRKSKTMNWGFIILLIISLFLLAHYIQRQRLYKSRFDKLMIKNEKSKNSISNQYAHELSPEVINTIINKIEEFETNKGFINHEITLQSLAKLFETNANYLSRVINARIGKNFSQYINDLRIEYAMEGMLSDKKLRKYTIKAIAEECGYRNAESFSKAFYKRNGIYPSYYIKKLNKTEQKD